MANLEETQIHRIGDGVEVLALVAWLRLLTEEEERTELGNTVRSRIDTLIARMMDRADAGG